MPRRIHQGPVQLWQLQMEKFETKVQSHATKDILHHQERHHSYFTLSNFIHRNFQNPCALTRVISVTYLALISPKLCGNL